MLTRLCWRMCMGYSHRHPKCFPTSELSKRAEWAKLVVDSLEKEENSLQQGGTIMTTSDSADRVNLARLQQLHPQWTQQQLADALGRSRSWVKKWLRRFEQAQVSGEP